MCPQVKFKGGIVGLPNLDLVNDLQHTVLGYDGLTQLIVFYVWI
jgi:hypothetical protein